MKMQEFTIKDLESFSGIKAHTIRIWEQRYGLLAPDRTDTGIRKYTDKDLKFLLNVSLLANLGYKISAIAKMSEEEIRSIIQEQASQNHSEQHKFHVLKISMLNYDEELFNSVFHEHLSQFGLEATFKEIIIPFMRQIGILWQANVICPAQEHFISCLVRQKIFAEVDKMPTPANKDAKPFVLYLPELEIHEISLVMLHYLLKAKGFRSIFLGQSVPFEDLIQIQQRLGEANFISIFTTNPNSILVQDYLQKVVAKFDNLGCCFYLTGNNLLGVKSPDLSIIHVYKNMEELLEAVTSLK